MVELITNSTSKIYDACKQHHVRALYVFGSAVRGTDFTENSDVDFLVEFDYADSVNDQNVLERVENFEQLKDALESAMNRKVDLIEADNIRNKYLRYFINKEKKLVYGLS